jgi:hypothetical protein
MARQNTGDVTTGRSHLFPIRPPIAVKITRVLQHEIEEAVMAGRLFAVYASRNSSML